MLVRTVNDLIKNIKHKYARVRPLVFKTFLDFYISNVAPVNVATTLNVAIDAIKCPNTDAKRRNFPDAKCRNTDSKRRTKID